MRCRHHAVIRRNHQYNNVRQIGPASAHRRKRRVTRRIKENNRLLLTAHLVLDRIGAKVLGDTTRLARRHFGFANVIQQTGLAVIDMTHDRNNRGPRLELLHFRLRLRHRRCRHHFVHFVNTFALLPLLTLKYEPVIFADFGGYIRLNRAVLIDENIQRHQFLDDLE